jgi:uncharacterized protein YfbU (UPF0304 family)
MSDTLELSNKDRLILANQYEILSMLDKDSGDYYAELAGNLRNGHPWLYRQALRMTLSENLPDEDAEHVLTILGIYSDLRASFKNLEDKSGLNAGDVVFPGFDGNNEVELLSFATALAKADRFTDTIGKHGCPNSHMPTTDRYKKMIERWLHLGKPRYPLSKDQINQILHGSTVN